LGVKSKRATDNRRGRNGEAMKFMILGDGYIGNYLLKHLPNAELFPTKIQTIDTVAMLAGVCPTAILINCGGKTGKPNVDWCEENKEETLDGNVRLPLLIAEGMKELAERFWIHIGSGCIYNGYSKWFTESDRPNFFGSFYSRSKIFSQDILSYYHNVCVLRIRMPIDEDLHNRCYITKVVKYAKSGYPIFNALNSMTVLEDLASAIEFVAEKRIRGVLNCVNSGPITTAFLLENYRKYRDSSLEINWKGVEEVTATLKAERSNCVLSNDKLKELGFEMPKLETRIIEILSRRGNGRKTDA
jgi:dTDP-4-dehydrorhamnose reductase